MHLHERTADTAIYILSGQMPLVADLHKRVLGTLGSVPLVADQHKRVLGTLGSVLRSNSFERELEERQILLKQINQKVGLSMSVQSYLSTICQVPLTF